MGPVVYGLIGDCQVRAIDEESRSAEFVAATENGVETFFGRQHLRISGARLQRYRKNPVVLDTHNRREIASVIGGANVRTDASTRELISVITFAETERAEVAWQLVKGGFVKAISVGFIPDRSKILTLSEGETDGDGAREIVGPAEIVRVWELFEISVVPVPADADAIRRHWMDDINQQNFDGNQQGLAEAVASLTRITERLIGGGNEEAVMAEGKSEAIVSGNPEGVAPVLETTGEIPFEVAARELEALKRQIHAIAPKGMETLAENCILQGMTLTESRTAFLEERNKDSGPLGTPEPPAIGTKPNDEPKTRVADLSDDEFARALCG